MVLNKTSKLKISLHVSVPNYCTEVRFASFFSGGLITAIVVFPPERKLAKRTSVDRSTARDFMVFFEGSVFTFQFLNDKIHNYVFTSLKKYTN